MAPNSTRRRQRRMGLEMQMRLEPWYAFFFYTTDRPTHTEEGLGSDTQVCNLFHFSYSESFINE